MLQVHVLKYQMKLQMVRKKVSLQLRDLQYVIVDYIGVLQLMLMIKWYHPSQQNF